jgi:hypothetical protein
MKEHLELPPHLQRMVDAKATGLDIMHGELKNLMLECEGILIPLIENSNELGSDEDYDDTVERLYNEGYMDALERLYQLTYDLSFAIGARNEA